MDQIIKLTAIAEFLHLPLHEQEIKNLYNEAKCYPVNSDNRIAEPESLTRVIHASFQNSFDFGRLWNPTPAMMKLGRYAVELASKNKAKTIN